ncbi:fatty acid desaturase 6 [Actinidia rufa]|uniref:Fatty acid desaturase 6 n=1 Tax=Actinidia rufa TaxID=165716 RepID=A0A7J0DIF4_9ERIC|nr:fatty acid desaturase 6 [Actinidia rufa]
MIRWRRPPSCRYLARSAIHRAGAQCSYDQRQPPSELKPSLAPELSLFSKLGAITVLELECGQRPAAIPRGVQETEDFYTSNLTVGGSFPGNSSGWLDGRRIEATYASRRPAVSVPSIFSPLFLQTNYPTSGIFVHWLQPSILCFPSLVCHDGNFHIPHHISPRIPSYNLRAAHQSLGENWGKYLKEDTWNWLLMKTILTVCHVYSEEKNHVAFNEFPAKESYPITFLERVMPDYAWLHCCALMGGPLILS